MGADVDRKTGRSYPLPFLIPIRQGIFWEIPNGDKHVAGDGKGGCM